MRPTVLLLYLSALIPSALAGQDAARRVLRGRALDAYSAFPIVDVRVVLTSGADTVGEALSDSAGYFQADVGGSVAWAHFTRDGYRADSARWEGVDLPLRVAMNPLAAQTIVVAAMSRSGLATFEGRARRGGPGRFITPERIAAMRPVTTSDLLRGIAGIRILERGGVIHATTHRAVRVDLSGAPPTDDRGEFCPMRIGVDGRIMLPGFSLDELQPHEIYGMEVYTGVASLPGEYTSMHKDTECGLVMIWTKAARERM